MARIDVESCIAAGHKAVRHADPALFSGLLGLVAGVEDDRVVRQVEDPVHRDRELHDPEVRAQLTARARDGLHEEVADLACGRHAAGYGTTVGTLPRAAPEYSSGIRQPTASPAASNPSASCAATSVWPLRDRPAIAIAVSCAHTEPPWYRSGQEVVPGLVDFEVAVPRLTAAVG